ncbi:MAG: RNA polymerase factor sigma-32 [Deltaproteobacteria bacterium]|nr:RNA polymerase factor sigma-32 [Deltaproteobacteria bacterium]
MSPRSSGKTSRRTGAGASTHHEERASEEDARSRESSEGEASEGSDREEGDEEIIEAPAEIVDGDDSLAPEPRLPLEPKDSSKALTRFDPLQAYLREVQRHPLLTPDEEHSLATRYAETGDVQAAARLVTANLRLVVKLAYEYRRAYRNIMDLIQEGNIGLMQAVKRYDPSRGVKLSSYAAWWIRAYILRFILNNWRLVKLGTTQAQRKLFFNLNKEKARLTAMGIEPSSAEIARRLNVEETEVVEMDRRLSSGEASLDAPVGDSEGRPVSRVEMMPSSDRRPDVMLADDEYHAMVRERLDTFRERLHNEKDIAIFDERLRAVEPRTLQEIGDRFGISRERVRQLEARLTRQLREYLQDELGEAVDAP